MNMESLKARILSLVLLGVLLGAWQFAVGGPGTSAVIDPEYAALMGLQAKGVSAMPTPVNIAVEMLRHISDPFYDKGPNDNGVGIQLAFSLGRVLL